MRSNGVRLAFLVLAGVTAAAACTDAPTEIATAASSAFRNELATDSTTAAPVDSADLVRCTLRESALATGTIDASGGLLGVGAYSISIPAGAVQTPTVFTVRVPATDIAEVEVSAAGVEHFVFGKPVSITVSYDGCTVSDEAQLTAWYVEPVTRRKLEKMGGSVNRAARTITFSTGHLSGYAIAD